MICGKMRMKLKRGIKEKNEDKLKKVNRKGFIDKEE
jgi:hypothetical protein